MPRLSLLAVALGSLVSATSALASPFGTYDPRSLGMGGVGVTTATARNANFFNPAMLAATRDDFALGLPIVAVGARATTDTLLDDFTDLVDLGDELSAQLSQFDTSPSPALASQAAATVASFNAALARVSNSVLDVDGFVGTIVSVPSKSVGVGVHIGGRGNFGSRFNYANADAALLTTLSDNLSDCANSINLPTSCDDARAAVDAQGNVSNLQSTLQVRGLVVRELGIAVAHRFESLHDIDLGVTMKAQRIRSFDYVVSSQNSDIDFELGQKDDNAVNLDLGATKSYGDDYKAGVVVKNLFKKDITTVLGNTIEMAPQIRLGVSHHRSWGTFGADLDITKNKPVATGFDQETQFLAIGAEFDAFSVMQLRVGYRHDLAGNYDGVPSIGLGFSPFGVHIDIAAAITDQEVAGAFQLGFNF